VFDVSASVMGFTKEEPSVFQFFTFVFRELELVKLEE
jgi:hypothetical protein